MVLNMEDHHIYIQLSMIEIKELLAKCQQNHTSQKNIYKSTH